MKKRYIIHAPIWHHRSGGLLALHNLMRALIIAGYDCVYYCWGSEHIAIDEVSDDDIVIYPEITTGNPLKAKNVVRWLLNTPGVIGGDGVYGENDMVFTHHPNFHHPKTIGQITPPFLEDFFIDRGLPKEYDCIWRHKGAWKPEIPIPGINITTNYPKTRMGLAELLSKCNTLYTYDDTTGLVDEAVACGCKIVLVNTDGSFSPYDFSRDILRGDFPTQLQKFIEITQRRTTDEHQQM